MAKAKTKTKTVNKAKTSDIAAKKTPAKSGKKVVARSKSPVNIKPAKKTSVKTIVKKKLVKNTKAAPKKPVAKKAIKKVIKKTVKKVVIKNVAPGKTQVPSKKAKSIAKPIAKAKTKTATQPTLSKASKPVKPLPPKKDRNAFDDKVQEKAARILKELEERMDLSKVKPRISVPTPAPKVKSAPAVLKLPEPVNTNKEKIQMEFEFRSSKAILFYHLSDNSGLAGWFADAVDTHEDTFFFSWGTSKQTARRVAIKELSLVRFQWDTETDGTYFQFEIKEDDITGDIALVVTDWANAGEKDSNIKLWESQVHDLRQLIGS